MATVKATEGSGSSDDEQLQRAIQMVKERPDIFRKPRLKKIYDDIARNYYWCVVYPPYNNSRPG